MLSLYQAYLFCVLALKIGVQSQSFISLMGNNNSPICSASERCVPVEHCSAMSSLMDRNTLSIHRFRQAVCGYDRTKAKVCCDVGGNFISPPFNDGNMFTPKINTVHECGRSLIRNNIDTMGSYPFVTRVGFINTNGELKYACSGVIITAQTILTAASCALTKTENYKLYSVLVGEYDTETNPDCNSLFCGHKTQSHNISYVIKHPNYDGETFANNVALLRLDKPIQFSATVQPVCLLPRDRPVNFDGTAILVGWGKVLGEKVKSSKQQALKMKVVPNQECSSYYSQGLSVEMCVAGEKVPCSGYSGSPVLMKHGDTHFLLGILSYGSSCSESPNFPSVSVSAQRYTRWILENC